MLLQQQQASIRSTLRKEGRHFERSASDTTLGEQQMSSRTRSTTSNVVVTRKTHMFKHNGGMILGTYLLLVLDNSAPRISVVFLLSILRASTETP